MTEDERKELQGKYPVASYLSPCVYPAETDEDRIALEAALTHHVQEAENAKWALCLRYFTNVAYLAGNQYATFLWNSDTNSLSYRETSAKASLPGGIEESIPKTVDNQLIEPYQTLISLLTEVKPEPRVTPRSSSPEDEDTAAIAGIIHKLQWSSLRMPFYMRRVGSYLATMGTAICEIQADVFGEMGGPGEPEIETITDAFTGEQTEQIVEQQEAMPDTWPELTADVWSPFHFQPDPGANEDPESLEWCYRHHYVDIGWLRDEFTIDGDARTEENGYFLQEGDAISEDYGVKYPVYWFEKIKDILETPEGWTQFSSRLSSTSTGFSPNQTLLRVWDCKPNPGYFPGGRTIIQAGDTVIYAGPARGVVVGEDGSVRYRKRWHKYAFTRCWTLPGRFWGMPLLSQLLPLQKGLNAIDSLTQMNRELGTVGQWLNPKQAKVMDGELSGLTGSIVHYTANSVGARPEKIKHEPLPFEYFTERDKKELAIKKIGGTESYLTTAAPSAVRSGSMIDLLTKKERQSRSPMLQDFEEFCVDTSRNILIESGEILGDESNPDFIARIQQAAMDSASHLAVATFAGTSLLQDLNISVDMTTALLSSPEAKQQKAMDALQYSGAQMSPAERAIAFSVMGMDEFNVEESSDYKRAKRMISVVTNGDVESQTVWQGVDDPAVFAPLLKAEIQSDRMYTYEPEIQQVLINLYLQYADLLQQQMEEQFKRQMMLEGGASGAE